MTGIPISLSKRLVNADLSVRFVLYVSVFRANVRIGKCTSWFQSPLDADVILLDLQHVGLGRVTFV